MPESIALGDLTLITERPTGTPRSPLLFVPGYWAHAGVFDRYLRFFASRGYPGFALNLRGRGGSRLRVPLGRVSIRHYVADALVAARWLGRPVIVGHSLGGLIAQKVAEQGDARAIVLIAPAPPRGISLASPRLLAREVKYLPQLMFSRTTVPRWDDLRALVLNRIPKDEQRSIFAQFVPDSGRAGREVSLGAISVDERRVRCPVLTIAGEDDRFIPARVARRVAAKYHACLHVIPGHGHLLIQEPDWQVTAALIADWLDRIAL